MVVNWTDAARACYLDGRSYCIIRESLCTCGKCSVVNPVDDDCQDDKDLATDDDRVDLFFM